MFFEDAKKEAKVSKIPNNVNIKNVSEPNIDTLTYSKAVKTNNKLSTVLKAKQALEFGKYFTFVNAALKPTDVKKIKNKKFDNLLFTNRKILAVLKKIEENMIDEQDTSIKHKPHDSKNQTTTKNVIAQNAHDENNSGLGLDLPDFKPLKTKTQNGEDPKGKDKQKVEDKNGKGTPKVEDKQGKDKQKVEDKQGKDKQNKSNEKPDGNSQGKRSPAYKRGPYKKQPKVEPTKEPVNEPGKGTNVNEPGKGKNVNETTTSNGTPNAGKSKVVRNVFIKTARTLARGASLVGTGIVIEEGVYQYVNAECTGNRMDAVASTVGALAGMYAGAQVGAGIGAAVGAPLGGIGSIPGAFAGGVIGAAIACSEVGLWISGKLKTPLDLIPDKFKNRGPQVEYVYIETQLLPYLDKLPYESNEEYNEDFDIVEKRMIELVEEMKKGSTEEQQKEWDKNKLINDGIVTNDLIFNYNSIKDWEKVESLPDSDLDILINDAGLKDLDRDRVREIKFMRNAKTNAEAQTAVSAIDRVNQAIASERKRLEKYKKENKIDTFSISGVREIQSDNYRRSLKTIEELQKVKRTMLGQAEKGDFKSIELDEKSREVNNNPVKQFNSLTLKNTSSAEYFASRNFNADEFATQWATCYSSGEDISKRAIADFSSIKAADIQFNKNAHLGFISGEFESGGNPGVIAKDNIGYAYGAWQINSRVGGLRDFIRDIETDKRFAHLAELKIDSPEFQDEWARVAKAYPNAFLEKQHKFIEKTKFKPVLYYARSAGLNTTNRAVQEVLWSQAVQHGFDGNTKIIDAAVKKVGKSSSADEIVRALYEARSNYVNGLSTLDDSLKANIINRYKHESSKAFGIILNEDLQNSEITKSVNSDTGSGISVIRVDDKSDPKKSEENENPAAIVVKPDKKVPSKTSVEDLNQGQKITINVTQVIQQPQPQNKQKSPSNQNVYNPPPNTPFYKWTVPPILST